MKLSMHACLGKVYLYIPNKGVHWIIACVFLFLVSVKLDAWLVLVSLCVSGCGDYHMHAPAMYILIWGLSQQQQHQPGAGLPTIRVTMKHAWFLINTPFQTCCRKKSGGLTSSNVGGARLMFLHWHSLTMHWGPSQANASKEQQQQQQQAEASFPTRIPCMTYLASRAQDVCNNSMHACFTPFHIACR